LIDIVANTDSDAIIYSSAVYALKKMGQPMREQILTFMRYSWDLETKLALAESLEVGGPDERVYQALVEVWREATWEDGKCLLAYGLAQAGGEQAIPLLEAALEDPELGTMLDYNEVAYALSELGVEAPPPPTDLESFDLMGADPDHCVGGRQPGAPGASYRRGAGGVAFPYRGFGVRLCRSRTGQNNQLVHHPGRRFAAGNVYILHG